MTAIAAANDYAQREWFSAAELAELGLPGLPGDKRSITRRAQEERWSSRAGADGELLIRARKGRGGGIEFHASLLPGEAQIELVRRGILGPAPEQVAPANPSDASGWEWYEKQSAKTRRDAERRLEIVSAIELLEASGMTSTAAVAEISARHGVGKSTLWGWMGLVDGIDPANRLPALAPRRTGGGKEAPIDAELWAFFKSDYLRPAQPTMTSCYRRTADIAASKGLSMPHERTFRRRLEAELTPAQLKFRREGEEGLRRSLPAERRTVAEYQVMEAVNLDGHKFDIFVKHPTSGKPIRPMMVALQDIRSSKIVGWRIGEAESAALTRLAFADMFRNFGIPRIVLTDNSRAFASKLLTGGAKSRFRFKIKPEDPAGLLTSLGIEVKWAKPGRGQSKPIERAFRDLASDISRSPAAEGAFTGNSPMAKPENYGSRAMEWDDFVQLVAMGIASHNARPGRRGRDYAGKSFDQVFAEGMKHSSVGKAPEYAIRMALLAAEQKLVNRQTAEIELFGNRYWSHECDALRGQKVTVRFDPDNLHSEIHLYDHEGAYLITVPLLRDSGFFDTEGARASAKRVADAKRQIREGMEAERVIAAEELAAIHAASAADRKATETPQPGAVRLVRVGNTVRKAAPCAEHQAKTDTELADQTERMRRGLQLLINNDD